MLNQTTKNCVHLLAICLFPALASSCYAQEDKIAAVAPQTVTADTYETISRDLQHIMQELERLEQENTQLEQEIASALQANQDLDEKIEEVRAEMPEKP